MQVAAAVAAAVVAAVAAVAKVDDEDGVVIGIGHGIGGKHIPAKMA